MGFQTVLFICLALSVAQTVRGQVWQFGIDNNPAAIVATDYSGQFSVIDKEQQIRLIPPPCHVITFVRVLVNNLLTSPYVYYNSNTNMVTIHYNLWQLSTSSFNIFAKASYIPGCMLPPLNQLPPQQPPPQQPPPQQPPPQLPPPQQPPAQQPHA